MIEIQSPLKCKLLRFFSYSKAYLRVQTLFLVTLYKPPKDLKIKLNPFFVMFDSASGICLIHKEDFMYLPVHTLKSRQGKIDELSQEF